MNYLPYFIARRQAAELDRAGSRPNPVLTFLVGLLGVAWFGFFAIAAGVVLWVLAQAFLFN